MMGPRLQWRGGTLEVRAGRSGLRTTATLLRDDTPVAQGRGVGRVLLPLPAAEEPPPAVLVLAPLPGLVTRTVLLVPRPREAGAGPPEDAVAGALDLVTAERRPFDPEPGTIAARLRTLEERHPRLWAARHVAAAVVRVVAGLLGLLVLLEALVRPLLRWLAGLVPDVHLPDVDLPDLPLPDLDLPSIPWPDVDLPDVTLPGWLAAVLATAKIWGPLLVGVGMAVAEVRRRRRRPAVGGRDDRAGDDAGDAHPRP